MIIKIVPLLNAIRIINKIDFSVTFENFNKYYNEVAKLMQVKQDTDAEEI